MTPHHWKDIEPLLDELLDLPFDQRTAFLSNLTRTHPHLADDLHRLYEQLQANTNTTQLAQQLDQAVAEILQESSSSLPESSPSESIIGPYRLLRLIGQGGMGTVFLAERTQGFHQRVALKLLHHQATHPDLRARFLRERQLLAQLQHPYIARLLDGGLTAPTPTAPSGQPYFVLEYVEGQTITTYCDEHRLSINERLRIFLQVGDAVHYAHRNLIVHRDLKPSNILITEDERGQPHVKLLDFGIAKLLAETHEEAHEPAFPVTQTGQVVLTPEYAAPEQVRGDVISTATDVYALGVLLYELLTGQRPYEITKRTPTEIERVVCELEPARPSTVVARTSQQIHEDGSVEEVPAQVISNARGETTERLRRRLSGDLDTMVLMALRKEPERRYASAEALGEDIKRYLASMPVSAQPDTLRYRTRKFAQRNRWGIAALGLVVALLLAVVIISVRFAVVSQQQAEQIVQEAAKAEAISEFLQGVFEVSDPDESGGAELTARELLDHGRDRIEEELVDQPVIQAEMMAVLGKIYHKLGLYDEAAPLYEQAFVIRKNELGTAHQEVATSMDLLGWLYENQGRYEEAETMHRQALALWTQLEGPDHPQTLGTISDLALLLTSRLRYEEADSLFQLALMQAQHLEGEDRQVVATLHHNLANLLLHQRKYAEAEPHYRQALDLRRTLLGKENSRTLITLQSLSANLYHLYRFEEAEALMREALETQRQHLGEEHPHTASTMTSLARLLRRQDKLEESEHLFRQALAIQRERLGDRHPTVLVGLNNVAVTLSQMGKDKEAESLNRQILALRREIQGEDHPHTAISLYNLSSTLVDQKEYDEAELLAREALTRYEKLHGDEHSGIANMKSHLGLIYYHQGRYEAADSLLRIALTTQRNASGTEHPSVATILFRLGRVVDDQEKHIEAEQLFREVLHIHTATFGEQDRGTANVQIALGACLTHQQRYAEAEPLLLEGYATLASATYAKPDKQQEARDALVALYTAWGKPDEAAPYQY